jgi:hypothetical protein
MKKSMFHFNIPHPMISFSVLFREDSTMTPSSALICSPTVGLRRRLLVNLLSKLYERTSVIITTNLSFGEWAAVFG